MENKYKFITILIVIITGLFLIFYKEEIKDYFKYKKIRQEVLNRKSVFNIPDVAVVCYNYLTNLDDDTLIDERCDQEIKKWRTSTERWDQLIKNKKDINCSDFLNGKDAKNFFHYINGELADCFYLYNKSSSPQSFGFRGDCNCTYDPYGLDTNRDFNACENLK